MTMILIRQNSKEKQLIFKIIFNKKPLATNTANKRTGNI